MIGSGAAAGRGLAGTANASYHGADDPRGPEEPPALTEEGGTYHWLSLPGPGFLGPRSVALAPWRPRSLAPSLPGPRSLALSSWLSAPWLPFPRQI